MVERCETVAGFLLRATCWFVRRGVLIERVLSDESPGYLPWVVVAACQALRLGHRRTRP